MIVAATNRADSQHIGARFCVRIGLDVSTEFGPARLEEDG
jgi:hypothetical protein